MTRDRRFCPTESHRCVRGTNIAADCRGSPPAPYSPWALTGCGTVVLTETGILTRYDRIAASDETASSSRIFVDPACPRRHPHRPHRPHDLPRGRGPRPDAGRAQARGERRRPGALLRTLPALRRRLGQEGGSDGPVRRDAGRPHQRPGRRSHHRDLRRHHHRLAGGGGLRQHRPAASRSRAFPGLGSLTVEAEALDDRNRQRAAMVWGGATNAFTNQARFSPASDAYDLAGESSGRISASISPPARIRSRHRSPCRPTTASASPRSARRLWTRTAKPSGRAPGIDGILGDYVGAPRNGPTKDRPAACPGPCARRNPHRTSARRGLSCAGGPFAALRRFPRA